VHPPAKAPAAVMFFDDLTDEIRFGRSLFTHYLPLPQWIGRNYTPTALKVAGKLGWMYNILNSKSLRMFSDNQA